jgi:hypothetical protein
MPKFPLYIPSKGRFDYMITSKVLTGMGLHHSIVVEPQEVEDYLRAVRDRGLNATIIELDMTYKEKYETCDTLGLTKSTGSGPARNFAWDHSISLGHKWHWLMDDNINKFVRWNRNQKIKFETGVFFDVMENFATRYKNVAMAGPHYDEFAPSRDKCMPFVLNSRIFSCNLIRNDVPFRWRGRYNEDLIMSIDMLKGGWCTILFNAFLQDKATTQKLPGGNTNELYSAQDRKPGEMYAKMGTLPKSEMVVAVHPDIARLKFRFRRWHHYVDFSQFKNRKLILRDDYVPETGVNEFGMELKTVVPLRKRGKNAK